MKKILVLLTLVSLIVCCCGAAMAEDHPDQIIRAATCGKAGLKLVWDATAGADGKGEYVTETIPATGKHDFKDGVIAATCTENKKIGSFCTVCGAENPKVTINEVAGTATGHKYGDEQTLKATCKKAGKIYQVCKNCGDEKIIQELPIDPDGHDWTVNEVFEEANCKDKKDGSMKRTCKLCEKVEYTPIAYTSDAAHKWDAGKVTKEATCTAAGVKTFTCSVCEATKTEEIKMLDHDYKEMSYEATCHSNKKIGTVCTVCGAQKPKTDMVEIFGTQLQHKWGEYKEVKATCKEASSKKRTCSLCGDEEIDPTYTVIPASDEYHVWGKEEVLAEASCKDQKNGSVKKTCSLCGKAEYFEIDWNDAHDFVEETVTAATCAEKGLKSKTCKLCNFVTYEDIDATGKHDYQEISRPADCEHDKMIGKVCTVCGKADPDAETEPTVILGTKLGHDWDYENAKYEEATCRTPSKDTVTCKRCGKVNVVVGNYLDEYNHAWGEPTVMEAANCKKHKNGSQKKVCTLCGEIEYTPIYWDADEAHNWTEEFEAPTCGKEGKLVKTCTVCGKVINSELNYGALTEKDRERIKATGEHDYQEIARDADCENWGVVGVFCTVCGEADPDAELAPRYTKAPLGHDWGTDSWVDYKGTCREPAMSYMVCQRCGETSVNKFDEEGNPLWNVYGIDPSNHDWDYENAVVFEEGTCKQPGKYKATCKICKTERYLYRTTDHEFDEGEVIIEPTCYERGWTKYTCQVCGYVENHEDIPREHVWTTTYNNGVELRVCSICGATDVTNHEDCVAGEPVKENVVAATCQAPGHYVEVTYCEICGKELKRVKVETEVGAHTPGAPVAENVTATGYDEVIYCTVCGEEISREAKTGEVPSNDPKYSTTFEFDDEEMTLTGKATLEEGVAPDGVYARVTYFMADGTFVVVSVPVEADGTYESMNSGDVIHVSVQIVDCAKVRPGDFKSFSK